MSRMKKKLVKIFALAFVILASGCGYSDYPGHPGHKTEHEAYVPSLNAVISGFGDYDGTYVYSVKYSNRDWMKSSFKFKSTITSYKNVVPSSLPHRPDIIPDADTFHRATGFSGGDFRRHWIAVDEDPNTNGFLDNFLRTQPLDDDGNWIEPGLILAMTAPAQEIDSMDWDLQSSVKSASELLTTLISNGGKVSELTLTVNAIELDGKSHAVDGFDLGFKTNGVGFNEIVVKNQKATKSVIEAILNNTENLTETDLKLHFSNGMVIPLPKSTKIMFNHSVLSKFAK
ncbi:hypothetical protein [Aliikangiella coralliicola]|uniref:Uncharacterized protein n=1 Tax=Aliikangiella coralliicola TaxID=2592383 RepID=A0A545UER5_9GAMM|nr:hypothetical protein [Aliikangiella coralliicola]TQV87970.1 hypothetical protein FLL46_09145 [Aliikangiella coralliicola]